MGLDISVYAIGEQPVTDGRNNETDDNIIRVFTEFEGSLGDITPGLYEAVHQFGFRAGSYSTYNRFRELVSMALLGRMPEQVWSDPHINPEAPGLALVRFSDCEGCIGPDVSRKLAKDLIDHREAFRMVALEEERGDLAWTQRWIDLYNQFIDAFEMVASIRGVVKFH